MQASTRIIVNTSLLYIRMGVTVLTFLVITRLILNSLGTSDFGLYNLVGGTITMLGFLNSTMTNATQRFMSYAEGEGIVENKKKVFNVTMVLHIFVAIITGILLFGAMWPLFGSVFNIEPGRVLAAKTIYVSLVLSTMFTILNVPYDSIINAHENMLYYCIVGIFEIFLKLMVAIACVYTSHDKLIVYGVLMAIIPFITLSIMKVYCHRRYIECEIHFRKYWDKDLAKRIASFSGWNFLTAISSLASAFGGGVVLNHFFGTILNAAQSIANQINGQLSAFSVNLLKAVNPVIVKRTGAQDIDSMHKVTIAGCKYSGLLVLFFSVPLILEMPYVLKLWLKNVPEWAVVFCRMQVVITLMCQSASALATAVYANGNIRGYAIYKSIMNFSPVLITFIAYSLGGSPVWLYISMIAIWAVGGDVVIVYYARKLCNIPAMDFVREVITPSILVCSAMLCGGFIIITFLPEGFFRLVFCTLATTLLFLVFTWLFAMKDEKHIVHELVSAKFNKVFHKCART